MLKKSYALWIILLVLASCSNPITSFNEGLEAQKGAEARSLTSQPQIKLYYHTGWVTPYLQYSADGNAWTGALGAALSPVFAGYSSVVVNASTLEFVPNNGLGSYDNAPGGGNYFIGNFGTYVLFEGAITKVSADIIDLTPGIQLYYKTGWDPANIVYSANHQPWIPLPGTVLQPLQDYTDYKYVEIDAVELEFALSNNGQGHFDNNEIVVDGGNVVIRNYHINFPGVWTLSDGVLTMGAPASQVSSITLTSDKSEIAANGVDTATLSTLITYQNGSTAVCNSAVYSANGVDLTGNTFNTTVSGDYAMVASFGGHVSNTVNITADDPTLIQGTVKDGISLDPVAQVTLIVSDGVQDSIFSTDALGQYQLSLPVLPAGSAYTLTFYKGGYVPVSVYNVVVREHETTTVETVLLALQGFSGTISGRVINAVTGIGIGGAALSLRSGLDARTGVVMASFLTDADGNYSLSLVPPGSYTIEASSPGFLTGYFTAQCFSSVVTGNQNGMLSPVLELGEIRAVLTWGQTPYDLDSHLTGPLDDGTVNRFQVFYGNMVYARDDGGILTTLAQLHNDDTNGFGPETTTIYTQRYNSSLAGAAFRFSVNNYSNRYEVDSPALSNSGAKMTIYTWTESRVFNVPAGAGTWWNICSVDGNGAITGVNVVEQRYGGPSQVPGSDILTPLPDKK